VDSARELFDRADTDSSGTVEEEEIRVLLIALQESHPHVTPFLGKTPTQGYICPRGVVWFE